MDRLETLNKLLAHLSLKIPELNEKAFLDSLYVETTPAEEQAPPPTATLSDGIADNLSKRLLGLFELPAQKRGYEYEKFLTELFTAYDLIPRSPFRLKGEQIDGSFKLGGDTC